MDNARSGYSPRSSRVLESVLRNSKTGNMVCSSYSLVLSSSLYLSTHSNKVLILSVLDSCITSWVFLVVVQILKTVALFEAIFETLTNLSNGVCILTTLFALAFSSAILFFSASAYLRVDEGDYKL